MRVAVEVMFSLRFGFFSWFQLMDDRIVIDFDSPHALVSGLTVQVFLGYGRYGSVQFS